MLNTAKRLLVDVLGIVLCVLSSGVRKVHVVDFPDLVLVDQRLQLVLGPVAKLLKLALNQPEDPAGFFGSPEGRSREG